MLRCAKCGRSNFLTPKGLTKHQGKGKCRVTTRETFSGMQGRSFTIVRENGSWDRYSVTGKGERVVEHYNDGESYFERVSDREWEAAGRERLLQKRSANA